jgi:ComF family protein
MEYLQRPFYCQLRIANSVDRWLNGIQQVLWPPTCVLCGRDGREGIDLCAACEADLPTNACACRICALPLADGTGAGPWCGACLHRQPAYQMSCIPFRYDYPLDHVVRGLKYRCDVASGRVLGELLARRIVARHEPLPEAMVPVPLAVRRYRKRGYNQATELALRIRAHTGVALRLDIASRVRETQEQTALSRRARRKNVRGVFAVREPLHVRHLAIVDDVVTTGSTVNELARALLHAGAERIEVWAIARAGGTT